MRSFLYVVLASLGTTGVAHGQHGFWQHDERVLITSFHEARGIATDGQLVFVATLNGLEIYDQAFRRWLLPSTEEDGYPVRERPARLAYDARERGVWLLTELGTLYAWSTAIQRWQQRFPTELPDDVARRLQRITNDRDPAWAIMRNFAGRDAAGRTWPVVALDAGERAGTFWAATNGGNFSFVDTRNLSSEPYTFGTVGRGVGALALAPGGELWFGSDGAGARTGITRADTTLQRWQHWESRLAEGPRGRVHALVAGAAGVYAAAADGVFSLRSNRWLRVADADARALARAGNRTWVGARGTLGWIDGTDAYQRAEFPVQNVHALAARGDSLWIGAETGLYRWTGGAIEAIDTGYPILDVAVADSGVVMITRGGVQVWQGARAQLPLRNSALGRIGRPVSLAARPGRVWVGGTLGLAEWSTTNGAWRYLTVPADIPEGPVYDVVEENGRVWLATPAGALRLNWK